MKKRIILYTLFTIILLFLYSYYIEPYNLIVKEYKIENQNLPDSFDGLKIVHFSDIHYGNTVDNKYLNKIIKLINKQKPDLVIFTGDFIDKNKNLSEKEINDINNILNNIESTLGNFAITGNHDIKHLNNLKKIYDGNFTLLNNIEKEIYYNNSTPISIIGIDNNTNNLSNLNIFNNENNNFKIVIVHEPDTFDEIKNNNFDIFLSGHSHNGQVKIPFIGPIYTPTGAKKYYDEYYKFNNKELFISNGIGTSNINIRFMSSPSINLYRLYK